MTFHVKIGQDVDGSYTAEVPAFKGCISQGSTYEEARVNIKLAIESWMKSTEDKEHVDKTELLDIDL